MSKYIFQHKIQENVTVEISAEGIKQAQTFIDRSSLFTEPMDWELVEEIGKFDHKDK